MAESVSSIEDLECKVVKLSRMLETACRTIEGSWPDLLTNDQRRWYKVRKEFNKQQKRIRGAVDEAWPREGH